MKIQKTSNIGIEEQNLIIYIYIYTHKYKYIFRVVSNRR